ncbi:MAG: hypothetical protein U0271_04205 [Polyangiaceae bacterium]
MSDKVSFYPCHPAGPIAELTADFAQKLLGVVRNWVLPEACRTLLERCALEGPESLGVTFEPTALRAAIKLVYFHERSEAWLPYASVDDSSFRASRWEAACSSLPIRGAALVSALLGGRALRYCSALERSLADAVAEGSTRAARAHARAVYADWLDQAGRDRAALFLRGLEGSAADEQVTLDGLDDPPWGLKMLAGDFAVVKVNSAARSDAIGYWTHDECALVVEEITHVIPGLGARAPDDEDDHDEDDVTALEETLRQASRAVARGHGLVTWIA